MATQNTFVEGADPTPLGQLSAAIILQMIREADPADNIGLVILQEAEPDIINNPWMARCYWSKPSAPLVVYARSGGAWARLLSLPGTGEIVTAMIGDGQVTNAKIVSVDWAKIINAPTSFLPSGAAGGDLTGAYPNPEVGPAAIDQNKLANDAVYRQHIKDGEVITEKIADFAINGSKIANGSISSGKLSGTFPWDFLSNVATGQPPAVAGQTFRRNATNTAWEPFTPASGQTGSLGEQALPGAYGVLTFPHAIGAAPSKVRVVLRCNDAGGDVGFAQNDELEFDSIIFAAATNEYRGSVVSNATNVRVVFPGFGNPYAWRVDSNDVGALTRAKWVCRVYAQ